MCREMYIYVSLEQFSNILSNYPIKASALSLPFLAHNRRGFPIPLSKGGKTNYSQFVIPALRTWDSRFLDNLGCNNLEGGGTSGVSPGVSLESRASKCMEIGNLTIRSQ